MFDGVEQPLDLQGARLRTRVPPDRRATAHQERSGIRSAPIWGKSWALNTIGRPTRGRLLPLSQARPTTKQATTFDRAVTLSAQGHHRWWVDRFRRVTPSGAVTQAEPVGRCVTLPSPPPLYIGDVVIGDPVLRELPQVAVLGNPPGVLQPA
jgi:hypothetical protein